MCGRYFIDGEMWREIKKICKQIDDSKLKVTRGDVRPTDMAVVLMEMGEVHPEHMCWGFMSKYQEGLLINARAETVLSKPSFRDSIRHCRCVIPAAGFYEWNKANERVSFTMPQSKILYMAGIWQPTAKEKQFTILTTSPCHWCLCQKKLCLGFRILVLQKSFSPKFLRFWNISRSTSNCHFLLIQQEYLVDVIMMWIPKEMDEQ